MVISIQTVFMIVLLVSAIVVAWLDASELFVAWYSVTEPPLSGLRFGMAMLRISCCIAIVSVLFASFAVGK